LSEALIFNLFWMFTKQKKCLIKLYVKVASLE
jgi:hypothetical protein